MREGKKKAYLLAALVFAALLLLGGGSLWAQETGQVRFRDMAKLLTVGEEAKLMTRAREIVQRTGYDLMLVTTQDAGGKSARDYAEDYYMEYKTVLDGVIYLIDMDNREIYVATSGEMRYYLQDERLEALLDEGYDRVSREEYGECFGVMLDHTEQALREGIEEGTYTVDKDTGEVVRYRKKRGITKTDVLMGLAVAFVSAGTVFLAINGKYKMKFKTSSYSYRDNSSLELQNRQDVFVNRIVTHRHIPKNPPPTAGGGPSSTVHTGSGGNSFGGGGRKF